MRVAVVAEYYPRAHDPVLGIWAHRQTQAALDAGVEPSVFVLHRLVPPAAAFTGREFRRLLAQPRHAVLDGVPVSYVRYVSPRRERAYAHWGRWAAPALRIAMRREERRRGPFDLVHAHNAIPAADAVLRSGNARPMIISIHGGDVFGTAHRIPDGERAVRQALARADLVLANSAGTARLARRHGAVRTDVLHLGTDVPPSPPPRAPYPLLVTVAHLVARKRHADVLRALARLGREVHYRIVGDGPERKPLIALTHELGVADRVEFTGQLAPAAALARAREGWLFVMPSTEEAFGVAYIEAMAAGIPAIGAVGEPGPAEIAAVGGGIELVAPDDPEALAGAIGALIADPDRLAALGVAARATVEAEFTWTACARRTLEAYRSVLGAAVRDRSPDAASDIGARG